jgi:two-component system phosphate regulon response regulator PhoB
MSEPLKTVAVLVANPALSSILSMTLAGSPSLRVRPFETELALRSYLQLVPADLIVADFDSLPARADRLAERLRSDPAISRNTQIIALASLLSIDVKAASIHAGIDEIIMKPMSPRYLVERVLARLAKMKAPERRTGFVKRDWSAFGNNVIPMRRAPHPQH